MAEIKTPQIKKNLKVNPASSLFTLNPSLSLPYIKYYTSFMEEYINLAGSSLKTKEAADAVQKDLRATVFPTYLRYKPYSSINSFPVMKIYRGDSSLTYVKPTKESYIKKVQENEVKEGDLLPSIPNPYTRITGKNSDVIFTYKSVNTPYSSSKLNMLGMGRYEEKDDITKLNNILSLLSTDGILKVATDSPAGNNGTMSSYFNQYLHSIYANKGINDTDYSPEQYKARYELIRLNVLKIISNVLDNIQAPSDKTSQFSSKIKRLGEEAKLLVSEIEMEKISKLKDAKIPVENKLVFKSYLSFQAAMISIELKFIASVMDEYISLAKSRSIIINNSSRINSAAINLISNLLYSITGLENIVDSIPGLELKELKFKPVNDFDFTSNIEFHDRYDKWLAANLIPFISRDNNISEQDKVSTYNNSYKKRYNVAFGNIGNMIYTLHQLKYTDPDDSTSTTIANTYDDFYHTAQDSSINNQIVRAPWYEDVFNKIKTEVKRNGTILDPEGNADKNDEYIREIMNEVIIQCKKLGISATAILAQIMQECGWFKKITQLSDKSTPPQLVQGSGNDPTDTIPNKVSSFNLTNLKFSGTDIVSMSYDKRNDPTAIAVANNQVANISAAIKTAPADNNSNWGWAWTPEVNEYNLARFRKFNSYSSFIKYYLETELQTNVNNKPMFDTKFMRRNFGIDNLRTPHNTLKALASTSDYATYNFNRTLQFKAGDIEEKVIKPQTIEQITDGSDIFIRVTIREIETKINNKITNSGPDMYYRLYNMIDPKIRIVNDSNYNGVYSVAKGTLRNVNKDSFEIKSPKTGSTMNGDFYSEKEMPLSDGSPISIKSNGTPNNTYKGAFAADLNYVSNIEEILKGSFNINPLETEAIVAINIRPEEYFDEDIRDDKALLDSVKKKYKQRGFIQNAKQHDFIKSEVSDSSPDVGQLDWVDVPFESTSNRTIHYGDCIDTVNAGFISLMTLIKPVAQDNFMKFKNLVVSNTDSKDSSVQTTITRFDIGMKNRNIPIFMDGHNGPLMQNFGGPRVEMNISIVTNDLFLLDNLATVAQELDLSYRTRNETTAVSPLNSAFSFFNNEVKTNSLVFNNTRKSILNRMKKLSNVNNSPIISGNMDAPILLTNNVANMAGIYGAVIQQIETSNIDGFPNVFQIDISLLSVDINQQFRETPRKQKTEVEPSLVLANAARSTQFSYSALGSDKTTAIAINNMRFGANSITSRLMMIYFLTYYVFPKAFLFDADGNQVEPLQIKKEDRSRALSTFWQEYIKDQIDFAEKANRYDGLIKEFTSSDNDSLSIPHHIYETVLSIYSREFLGPLFEDLATSASNNNSSPESIRQTVDKYINKLFKDFRYCINNLPIGVDEELSNKAFLSESLIKDSIHNVGETGSNLSVGREILNRPIPDTKSFIYIKNKSNDNVLSYFSMADHYNKSKSDRSYLDENGYFIKIGKESGIEIDGNTKSFPIGILIGDYVNTRLFRKSAGRKLFDSDFYSYLIYKKNKINKETFRQELSSCFYGELSATLDPSNIDIFSEYLTFTKTDKKHMDILSDVIVSSYVDVFKELRKTNIVDTFFKIVNADIVDSSKFDAGNANEIRKISSTSYDFSDSISQKIREHINENNNLIGKLEVTEEEINSLRNAISHRGTKPYEDYLYSIYIMRDFNDLSSIDSLLDSLSNKLRGEYKSLISLTSGSDVFKKSFNDNKRTNSISTDEKIGVSTALFADYAFGALCDLYYKIYSPEDHSKIDTNRLYSISNIMKNIQFRDHSAHRKDKGKQGKDRNLGSINRLKHYYPESTGLIDSVFNFGEQDTSSSRTWSFVGDITEGSKTDHDFESNSGIFFKDEYPVSFKKTAITMYRMVDNYTFNILMPMISNYIESGYDNVPYNSLKKHVVTLFDNIKKINTSLDRHRPTYLNIRNDGTTHPMLIPIISKMTGAENTMFYDRYNCYPDRPLPLLLDNKDELKYLSSLQLFTTPDFFILKDASRTNLIIDDIENKIGIAQKTLASEYVNKDNNLTGTHEEARNQIRSIGDKASDALIESKGKFIRAVHSYINNITLGVSYNVPRSKDTEFATELYTKHNGYAPGNTDDILDPYRMIYYFVINFLSADKIDANISNLDQLRINIFEAKKAVANLDFKGFNWDDKTDTAFRLYIDKQLKVSEGINKLAIEITSLEESLYDIQAIANANTRLNNKERKGFVSTRDMEIVKQLINPSAGAYNLSSVNVMKNKLTRLKYKLRKNGLPSTIAMSFPTFKFYILEEDAKEWLFFNDFYDYSAIKSIKVHKNRKDASSTANIVLSNNYGRLTNMVSGRRTTVENPFYARPSEEEEVNSMMLKEGARIQIRLGYNSHLGSDAIVFSGRIQQMQGTSELNLVCQSDGIELTRDIGTGTGDDMTGILGRITVPFTDKTLGSTVSTNSTLGLITALFDSAGSPLRGLGTKAPYVGVSRIRNITSENIEGITTGETNYGFVRSIGNFITNKVVGAAIGITPALIDTRLTNININPSDGSVGGFSTLFGKSRWLIYNENIWEALQDYMLQLGNRLCTVRSFDEENTVVIDTEDGIYQRSIENFPKTSRLYPIIRDLTDGEKSSITAIHLLSDMLNKEYELSRDFASFDVLTVRSNVKYFMQETLRGLFQTNIYNSVDNIINELDDRIDTLLDHITYNDRLIRVNQYTRGIYKNTEGKEDSSIAYKLDNSAVDALAKLNAKIKAAGDGETINDVEEAIDHPLEEYLLAYSVSSICKYFKHAIASSSASFRPLVDFHIKSSHTDIIQNNIKVVSGYNRVELSYLHEDVIGSFLQIFGVDTIGQMMGFGQSIRIDNINKPESYTKTATAASRLLEADRVMTYGATQKNAGIRGTILIDNPKIVANSVLGNLMRDYYDGDLVMLLDPTIEPYDIIYLHDVVNDMWGMVQVKDVTHSFSEDTGAVTVVTPDLYVKMSQDGTKQMYSGVGLAKRTLVASSGALVTLATIGLGAGIGKIAGRAISPVIRKFKGATTFINKPFIKNAIKTTAKGQTTRNSKNFTKTFNDKSINTVYRAARKRATSTGASNVVQNVDGITKSLKELNITDTTKINKILNSADGLVIEHLTNMTRGISGSSDISKRAYKKLIDAEINNIANKIGNANWKSDVISIDADLDSIVKKVSKNLDETVDALVKTKNSGLPKGSKNLIKESEKASLKDDALENFITSFSEADSVINNSDEILGRIHKASIDDFFNVSNNLKTVANPMNLLSFKALKPMFALGLSKRIGSFFLPTYESFSMHVGEYLNYQPITIAGLIHKGEPLIGNLDGMKRYHTKTTKWEFLSYKVGESFNQFRNLLGDLESTLYTTENEIKDSLP
jgi:hypothetical protein